MKYVAPDFERVSITVETVFADYPVGGCVEDEGEGELNNVYCAYYTFVTLSIAHQCYSTYNE